MNAGDYRGGAEERHNAGDFSVAVPETWRRKSIITFVEPGDAAGPASVVVTQDLADVSISSVEMYAMQQHELLARLPGFTVDKRTSLAVCGAEVPYLVYSWRPSPSLAITQHQVYVYRAPHAWTITGTPRRQDGGPDGKPHATAFETQFLTLATSFDMGSRSK